MEVRLRACLIALQEAEGKLTKIQNFLEVGSDSHIKAAEALDLLHRAMDALSDTGTQAKFQSSSAG